MKHVVLLDSAGNLFSAGANRERPPILPMRLRGIVVADCFGRIRGLVYTSTSNVSLDHAQREAYRGEIARPIVIFARARAITRMPNYIDAYPTFPRAKHLHLFACARNENGQARRGFFPSNMLREDREKRSQFLHISDRSSGRCTLFVLCTFTLRNVRCTSWVQSHGISRRNKLRPLEREKEKNGFIGGD